MYFLCCLKFPGDYMGQAFIQGGLLFKEIQYMKNSVVCGNTLQNITFMESVNLEYNISVPISNLMVI